MFLYIHRECDRFPRTLLSLSLYKNPKPLFLRTFMNLGVGWVEERNPTTKNLSIVGLRYAPTPLVLCRETRPPQWLPNLHLFLYFQSDKKGLIRLRCTHKSLRLLLFLIYKGVLRLNRYFGLFIRFSPALTQLQ